MIFEKHFKEIQISIDQFARCFKHDTKTIFEGLQEFCEKFLQIVKEKEKY